MAGYTTPYVRPRYDSDGLIRLAEFIARSGRDRAEGLRRGGEISAQGIQQAGQAIAGGLQAYGQEREQAPIRAAQLQGLQDEQQLRGLNIAAARRQAADVGAMDQAGQVSPTDRSAFLSSLPGHLRPEIEKKYAEVDKLAGDAKAMKQKAAEAEADYFGGLAASIKPYLSGEDRGLGAVQLALQHAKEQGYDTTHIEQHLQQNPDALPTILDGLIQQSPTQRKLLGEEADRALRTKQEEHAIEQARQAAADRTADNARLDATAAEAARHNRAVEANTAANDSAVPTLNPAGMDAAAKMYAQTGQLPAMGMGGKAANVRAAIINRAAELYPDLNIAANKADFSANSGALTQIQKQRDAIGAFEQTAQKNIDIFLKSAEKVVDTGSPIANIVARKVTGTMLGSPDQAAYNAARQVAINEIAKITSNPTLAGTLSDSARHEVEAFNPESATLKQTVAVMRLLKQDMTNRTTSLDEQLATIRGRMGNGAAAPAVSAPPAPAGWKYIPKAGGGWTAVEDK